ncbi:hypothetical protein GCM10027277_06940 [Pseudoduganella ginsengisoli]|uniref:SGNH/GDSL hydrolase family protein n=1 Tax=Pseudoduganella ginsengisoli TaxID=1462440 RepID=A0A6L6Q5T4_9BURK|nr:SGNH/GDSL hydrolase family protein [Pseudoduganella ginsengisoli]MTW05243.1 SGNH/GDSL hydrolase family protein [Pseudoduganella ginsengisoli]
MQLKKWTAAAISVLAMHAASAQHELDQRPSQQALIVIGASYSEAKTPFNNGIAPQGGRSVNQGLYLSLGAALTRDQQLPGYVINEAQAGAGTFTRFQCPPGAATCSAAVWDSYQVQLQRALPRVAKPAPATGYNAKYVVITIPNDCLHAGGMGVPQPTAPQCTEADMHATADRLVALGNFALTKGLTPIFTGYPKFEDLDMEKFRASSNVAWVIDEQGYNTLRNIVETRLAADLPDGIQLNVWKEFNHIGDGLHPDPATTRKAAHLLATHLRQLDN